MTSDSVEPNRVKRSGLGLRALDLERACPGYTLFAPTTAGRTVYLIDLNGDVVHTWEAPYPPGMYGYLSDRGTLVYNGRTSEARNDFIGQSPWKGGALVEMDWNGEVLLEVRHPDHHHDGRLLRNGNVALLCMTAIPRGLAARVVGGLPRTEHEGEMYADYVVEITPAGEVVWEWFSWEHLDPETDSIDYAAEHRAEWTHGNTIAELSSGDLMVSFRNISTVAIIDRRSGQVSWKVGPPLLAQQHAPVELQSGNLLIFDNGTHRSNHPVPFSRVVELNRASKEIVWSYQERLAFNFFSPYISNAERLFNGNTLICEGNFGRLFEVTPEGELVWEFVNPYFDEGLGHLSKLPPTNAVFRTFRYTEERIWRGHERQSPEKRG